VSQTVAGEFERRTGGGPLKGDMRHKSHLLFAWLAEEIKDMSAGNPALPMIPLPPVGVPVRQPAGA
jgi:hypothetical protein